MKNKKSIFSKILIAIVCIFVAVLFIVYVIPGAIVTIMMTPSLKYSINQKKGLYPSAKELGNAVWEYNASEINIELITIDGNILGEISTKEKTFTIKGKFLYNYMYLYCSHQEDSQEIIWKYCEHTVVETTYEYENEIITCSNVKTDSDHFDFSKDFTLTKKKGIDKSHYQKWKCEEADFQLITYDELNNYAIIERNSEKYKLTKEFDNCFSLTLNGSYKIYGIFEKTDKIVFTIIGKNAISNIPAELQFLEDLNVLTFYQDAKHPNLTGDGSLSDRGRFSVRFQLIKFTKE